MTCALVLAGAVQQASALDMVSTKGVEVPTETAVYGESVARRGFTRQYTKYLKDRVLTEVMSDSNWDIYSDDLVTVTFVEASGPEKCSVKIYYRHDDEDGWKLGKEGTIGTSNAIACSIPAGYTFKVMATLLEGENGNATFQVVLS